jgi:predicted dithiol-disulfide oxidoreductase (DUF899 family)
MMAFVTDALVSDESSAAPLSQEAYIKMKERALDAEQEIERLREALKLARTDLMVAIREIDRELEFPLQERDAT